MGANTVNTTHTKILLAVSVLITPTAALAEITQSKPAIKQPVNIQSARGGVHDGAYKPSATQQTALEQLEREYEREKAKLNAQLDGLKRWYKKTKASLENGMAKGGAGDDKDEHLFPTNPGQQEKSKLSRAGEASENERKRAKRSINQIRRALSKGASFSNPDAHQPAKRPGQGRIQPIGNNVEADMVPDAGNGSEDDSASRNGGEYVAPDFARNDQRGRGIRAGGRSIGGGAPLVGPGRSGVAAPTPPAVSFSEGRNRGVMPDLPNLNPRFSNERRRGSASIRDLTDEQSAELDERIEGQNRREQAEEDSNNRGNFNPHPRIGGAGVDIRSSGGFSSGRGFGGGRGGPIGFSRGRSGGGGSATIRDLPDVAPSRE